jgi:hypothetical protein
LGYGQLANSLDAGLDTAPAGGTVRGAGIKRRCWFTCLCGTQVAPETPLGRYTMNLWVDDGIARQSVPVVIMVTDGGDLY